LLQYRDLLREQYRDLLRECKVLMCKSMGSVTVVQGSYAEFDFHTCATEHKLAQQSSCAAIQSSFKGMYGTVVEM